MLKLRPPIRNWPQLIGTFSQYQPLTLSSQFITNSWSDEQLFIVLIQSNGFFDSLAYKQEENRNASIESIY